MAETDRIRAGAQPDRVGALTGDDPHGPPRVELRAVWVQAGALTLLEDLNLSLPLNARVVVLGPNGAGKTSLLRLLQGLQAPARGELRIDAGACGAPPAASTPARRLAYVFQKPVMLRRSARANIEHALGVAGMPRAARGAAALAALARVGLAYAAERPARSLSGGEQQRVALARARALDPLALLLDEPTASLDPGAAAGIERELMRLSQEGTGLIIATHDLALARRIATDVVFLHRGRVREWGPAARCFEAPADPHWCRFLAGQWLE
ncbi:MAG: ATP-binding cassette domain-containing protein [Betaproteobacteria bacterium]|nr:ATP-binding cassette domain-containing protein [Betaproteobacteria bacterium]